MEPGRKVKGEGCEEVELIPNIPLGYEGKFQFVEQGTLLGKEDTLVLYTDGITEALNEKQELFGPGRLERALRSSAGRKPLRSLLDSLLEILHGFIGKARQSDDVTVLMIQYKGQEKK